MPITFLQLHILLSISDVPDFAYCFHITLSLMIFSQNRKRSKHLCLFGCLDSKYQMVLVLTVVNDCLRS